MGVRKVFKIDMPFTEDELRDVQFEQSADVVYFAHPNHAPHKIVRFGHTQWVAGAVTFGTKTTAPTGVAATDTRITTGGFRATTYTYGVTAVDALSGAESLLSGTDDCVNDLTLIDNYNTITYSAVTGADFYNVYRSVNGIFGYIGTTEGLTFRDDAFAPDLSDTPPTAKTPFDATDHYPAAVTFFEQRLVWGRTNEKPSAVFGSQTADFENMNVSRPTQAADAYTFNLVGRQVNAVRHLLPMKALIALCDTSIKALAGPNGLITPTEIDIKNQAYRGSSRVRPLLIDEIAFYVTSKGSALRTLGFSFEVDGYKGNDITVYAPHLFKDYSVVEMAWCEHPTATIWVLRDDGKLASLTWLPEQEVWGWSLCETDGVIESICSITENGEDVLYAVIQRTIGEETRRYVERLASPVWSDVQDAVYVDCAGAYDGSPATVISGLGYLEGRAVSVLADGAVVTGHTVTGGQITLAVAASKVIVGLAYEAWVQTLPAVLSTSNGSTKGSSVTTASVILDVVETRGVEVSGGKRSPPNVEPTSTNSGFDFFEANPRTTEDMGDAPYLMNGEVEVSLASTDWSEGSVVVRQRNPLPMHVTGIFPDVKFGK